MRFVDLPAGFVLGTSTASYQIEGAVTADGRGRSIWDTFCERPGAIRDGSSGAVACDHYHRMAEDVALMAGLGVGGYRFSLAWPRIQPTGRGAANGVGLDFYDRLVDGLLEAGIAPMATLYHWDLPQALQDAGGWASRETAERFGEYAALVAARLGDRVAYWCPVNEPNVHTMLGHGLGTHAPGVTDWFGALPVAHHLLLGHARAVAALRSAGAASIGTATNHTPVWRLSDSASDRGGAAFYDALWNWLFADPVLLGRYPDELGDLLGLLPVADGDLAAIHAPLDFYGVNYYFPSLVGASGATAPAAVGGEVDTAGFGDLPFSLHEITGHPTTEFGWPVVPSGLTDFLVQLRDRCPELPSVHVTENGCAWSPAEDRFRIDYLHDHLAALAAAREAGIDVRGYWTWSLMDNFEWAEGFTKRFGLVEVDYDTLERRPRASYHWYREQIAHVRGAPDGEPQR
ncbi:MAG: GH1 family beta-glucosidase [Nocardioides sp.]|uniref:GH1 family beta-glucosidase n=1 Tax=Nocardioides sp. TaxID=35761 RepID=UPI0039E218E4